MKKLLQELGIGEDVINKVMAKHDELIEEANKSGADAASAADTKISELETELSNSGVKYTELEGKYNEAAAKLKSAGVREFLYAENIGSAFVRGALAKEIEAQGYDLDTKDGQAAARKYIEVIKKDNPTLFESGKPYVSTPPSGTGSGGGAADGVAAAFYGMNPKLKGGSE